MSDGGEESSDSYIILYISGTTSEVFIHENRRRRTMLLCQETVQDNIGVNTMMPSYAEYSYSDGDSDSDSVRCFRCIPS